jgi:hypothetical protein
MEVAPELTSLREDTAVIAKSANPTELSEALSGTVIRNRAGEVICTFTPADDECTLELQLKTREGTNRMIALAYSKANGAPFVAIGDRLLPLSPDAIGDSTFHLWVDGSIIETFIDRKQAVTTRYYGAPEEPGEIRVVWSGPVTSLKSITISAMKPISSDRLTT